MEITVKITETSSPQMMRAFATFLHQMVRVGDEMADMPPAVMFTPEPPQPRWTPSKPRSSSMHVPMPGYSSSQWAWTALVPPNTFMKGTRSVSRPVSVRTNRSRVFTALPEVR